MMEKAKELYEKMFQKENMFFQDTDPEYSEIITNFAFGEVAEHGNVDEKTRMLAILAALMGCQGIDLFREMVAAALKLERSRLKL